MQERGYKLQGELRDGSVVVSLSKNISPADYRFSQPIQRHRVIGSIGRGYFGAGAVLEEAPNGASVRILGLIRELMKKGPISNRSSRLFFFVLYLLEQPVSGVESGGVAYRRGGWRIMSVMAACLACKGYRILGTPNLGERNPTTSVLTLINLLCGRCLSDMGL